MIRTTLLVGTLALLAACGSRTALKPLPGMAPIPKAATAKAAQTPDQLMTPSTQARPDRTVDLRTRSVERQDDPFDTAPDAALAPMPGTAPEATPEPAPESAPAPAGAASQNP